jgi:hypothetical protein
LISWRILDEGCQILSPEVRIIRIEVSPHYNSNVLFYILMTWNIILPVQSLFLVYHTTLLMLSPLDCACSMWLWHLFISLKPKYVNHICGKQNWHSIYYSESMTSTIYILPFPYHSFLDISSFWDWEIVLIS